MATYDLYAAGNALMDIVVEVSEAFLQEHGIAKGRMTLTKREQQQALLAELPETKRLQSSGGSAANTAVAFAQLGGRAFYSCQVGADALGRLYLKDLKKAGVHANPTRAIHSEGPTGTCLVMVSPDAERSMHTYLGITTDFAPEQLDEEALQAAQWLYLEGYLVTGPHGPAAMQAARKMAQRAGVRSALSLSDPSVVEHFRAQFATLLAAPIDLLFCNEEEARLLAGTQEVSAVDAALRAVSRGYAMTRGAHGARLFDGKNHYDIPAYATQVVDTNGAGDMFAGAFLHALVQGADFAHAGKKACQASAAIVSQLGPRLVPHALEQLRLS